MKSILFDLDGTLVDSSYGIKEAFKYCFTKLSNPIPDDNQLKSFIGPPLETTFSSFYEKETDIQCAIALFREYYSEKGVYQVKLYPNIEKLLAHLIHKGYKLFIATSKHEKMATLMLKELNIHQYFTAVYGSIPNRFKKEDVIKACLLHEHLDPKKAVIIGDTKFDIVGGKHCNIQTIGVTWGFGTLNDLEETKPDFICHNSSDIKKALE